MPVLRLLQGTLLVRAKESGGSLIIRGSHRSLSGVREGEVLGSAWVKARPGDDVMWVYGGRHVSGAYYVIPYEQVVEVNGNVIYPYVFVSRLRLKQFGRFIIPDKYQMYRPFCIVKRSSWESVVRPGAFVLVQQGPEVPLVEVADGEEIIDERFLSAILELDETESLSTLERREL